MTHTSNISIPARLVFRPYRVRWNWTRATLLSWGEKTPELRGFSLLRGAGKVEFTGESVIVHIAVWRGRDDDTPSSSPGILNALGISFDYYAVRIKRSELPPDCLQDHEDPDSTPNIEGREFDLLVCRLPVRDGLEVPIQPEVSIKNAWDMRSEFFTLGDDLDATCRFLNRWGLWNFQLTGQPSWSEGSFSGSFISPHRLWSIRDAYIRAAAGSPRAWLSTANPLNLKQTDKVPYFIVERSFCEDAIKATITIDHLANVKFGICNRHDCRKLFKRTTAQKRLYCSPECAHLANVRKLRAMKSKAKGVKKNAKA